VLLDAKAIEDIRQRMGIAEVSENGERLVGETERLIAIVPVGRRE
jgi:hypothetical protein